MKKKIVSFILLVSIFVSMFVTNVSAYKFPQSFWKINDAYLNAVKNNDYNSIIKYGKDAIALMEKEPQNETEVINVLADRIQKLANIYEEMGDYNNSAIMYERLVPYARIKEWNDSIIIAETKAEQFKSKVELYTDNGISPYFGAINEPRNGVLYGIIGESGNRSYLENESAILVYHELGREMYYYMDSLMTDASEKGLCVEFAINCLGEANDIVNFENFKWDIANISQLFNRYPDVKFFVRFGAEVNIWGNKPDTEQFKNAFRYVSDYFKNNNSNVAVVWSVGSVNQWGADYYDYYPGDAYVDWVGVSLYSIRYFQGNPNAPSYEAAYFRSGENADPVLNMKEIIEKFGDRKPIMISESGQSWRVDSQYISENTTEWAIDRMKEVYNYLPMVYPEIKMIMHFDKYMNEMFKYSLGENPDILNTYLDMISNPRLIKGDNFLSSVCYRPLYNGVNMDKVMPLSAYVHVYNDKVSKVDYYVDGSFMATASKIPYSVCIGMSDITPGEHIVEAVVVTERGQVINKMYNVNVAGSNDIGVYVSGNMVEFDQKPLIHNGRTIVPLRAIFEALGARVEWDQATSTATSYKDDVVVSLTINNDILLKNGEKIVLDVPALLVNGRTMVPVRAISEAFGLEVGWDSAANSVVITQH